MCTPFGIHGVHSFCTPSGVHIPKMKLSRLFLCFSVLIQYPKFVPQICALFYAPFVPHLGHMGHIVFVPNFPWRHGSHAATKSHFRHVTCVVILPWHSPWRNGKCHGIITIQVTWQMPKYCYNTSAMAKMRIVLQHKGHGNMTNGAQKLYASCSPNGAQIGH